MAKVENNRFEYAGWLFWAVGVAILIGPAIYLSHDIMISGTSVFVSIALGTTLAVLISGVVTATVNAFLQRAAQKRRAAQKAAQRKKSKK